MESLQTQDLALEVAFHGSLFADLIWAFIVGGLVAFASSLFQRRK